MLKIKFYFPILKIAIETTPINKLFGILDDICECKAFQTKKFENSYIKRKALGKKAVAILWIVLINWVKSLFLLQ